MNFTQGAPNDSGNERRRTGDSSPSPAHKALKMMQKMGYKSGCGLGKHGQGTTTVVEIEKQLGTRGLGLKIESLNPTNEQWDFSSDTVAVEESVEWLQNSSDLEASSETMETWVKEAAPNHNIEQEFNFCDKEVLKNVIKAKNIFDQLDLNELCQARARANPFESVRSVFFMNRAALKMANIDAATDFMFTNVDGDKFHGGHSGPYYFADVCAGPGGFTEYILWRKKWTFKGFGFTLRDENDFKLASSVCASPATFLPLYGVAEDGNICRPQNIIDFKLKVLHETKDEGVHFVMADGGFSVEGNENLQEVLSKNIYVCQCLTALEVLRKHGHFVTKLFDTFTGFSVGLLYLMYKSFEKVCILKPNSSRPANSERYFVCYNYKGGENVENIKNYVTKLVNRLWHIQSDPKIDLVEIVPLPVMRNDKVFCSYICRTNNRLAKKQTLNLEKLSAFCRNPSLIDFRQEQLRTNCLIYWKIPDRPKIPPYNYKVDDLLNEAIDKKELLALHPHEISTIAQLSEIVTDCRDWHYTMMQCSRNTNICNFYAGVGVHKVCRLQCKKWVKVKNVHLTQGTLLYGELVKEKSTSTDPDDEQSKYSLHVIDALRLGDQNLSNLNFDERHELIRVYCAAVNHEFRTNAIRVRSKNISKLQTLPLTCPNTKNSLGSYVLPLPVLGYNVRNEFFEANSVLLLKTNNNQSFQSTYVLRLQLFIDEGLETREGESLSLQALINFVKEKMV